jgi:hypothetical protein
MNCPRSGSPTCSCWDPDFDCLTDDLIHVLGFGRHLVLYLDMVLPV